jgi:hypothetical protein
MRWALALLAVLLLMCDCSSGHQASALHLVPLDRPVAEQVALRADDARRDALMAADTAGLTALFRGSALQMLQAQVRAMRQRGLRLEERDSSRTLVFWDARAREVVLQVEAQRRLVTPEAADPAWTATVRQSWSRLDYVGGAWWIDDEADLTPDRWRPVPPSA